MRGEKDTLVSVRPAERVGLGAGDLEAGLDSVFGASALGGGGGAAACGVAFC